jgi:phage terminase large subunit-like protein
MGLRGRNAQPLKRRSLADASSGATGKRHRTRAAAVIAWIEQLKITSGVHAGRPFKLRPWQKKIIQSIYATDKSGKRKVRQALISVPRKNGKTQLAAALALCHLCGPEAKQRGQVYSAAADRAQAALIFREMRALIEDIKLWTWRRGWDSNPRYGYPHNGFRVLRFSCWSVPLSS